MTVSIRPPADHDDPRAGSMGLGFALGFGVMLGSALLSGLALFAISELSSTVAELLAWPALMLTPGAMLALFVWAYATGRTRTGAGILAAYGAMFALALLLVAACFGMLMTYH